MAGFLTQLGKDLADRWLALLVLPGLLWLASAAGASHMDQADPVESRSLIAWLQRFTGGWAEHHTAAVALGGALVLLASAAAGLAASALGLLVQRLWGAAGTRPPLSWVLRARQRRWAAVPVSASRRIGRANDPDLTGTARLWADALARRGERRRLAQPPHPPGSPTHMAERFQACSTRAHTLYGLELDLVWPRLWTVLPEALRTDITAAADAYAASARLAAWALLYAVLAVMWWPAVLVGAAVLGAATVKARMAAGLVADLIDTAIDLHLALLADKLHIPAATPPTPDTGRAITQRLTVPHGSALPLTGQPARSATPAN